MSTKTKPETASESTAAVSTSQAMIARHSEFQSIVLDLQRKALRLSEMGYIKVGGLVLAAAVTGSKTKPGLA